MLVELVVENLAVVERLRLRLHAGFNVLTGETGSGKSLVVDALGLLLGGRASAETIRSGAPRAFVSGIFELPDDRRLKRALEEAGIEAEEGELLIEREVTANGKSRAFAASRPVTAAFLREIAPFLGDIHGQHDQQRLFDSVSQRELLDEAAGAEVLAAKVAAAWGEWRSALGELAELDRAEQEKLRMADLWNMQRREIEALGLVPGEDAQLENERRVLKNVARLSESAAIAAEALSEGETSAVSLLGVALKRAEELARIDESARSMADLLRPAQIAVQEAARELSHYLARLEADPARLEQVETRLASIERLKRKYGTTIEEVLRFLDQVSSQLAAVETAGERRAELGARIAALEMEYRRVAGELSALRQKCARKLERQVEAELAALAMKGARFIARVEPSPPSEQGMDSVQFQVSANLGEEARPLEKVASGGELSRIALAIKTCIASRAAGIPRTLVFDEVDAGVGGAAAETIGRRLKQLAGGNQVLCVTHLAQIASFADHHYVVSKRESEGRTVADVAELGRDARIREIGRMLSGQKLSEEALKHAAKLLEQAAAR
ncbi:MAG: DNA repair protein RecN [Bryobacteraceae bacterium]|nr:DNA repair protein RecN [Bryobacteraceae bacterium]